MTDDQFTKLLALMQDHKKDRMGLLTLVLSVVLPGLAAAAVWGTLQADVRHNAKNNASNYAAIEKNEARIENMQSKYVTKTDLREAEGRIQRSIQQLREN